MTAAKSEPEAEAPRVVETQPPRAAQSLAITQPAVDEDRVRAAGIRKVEGKHLTLYTDVPKSDAVDRLPDVFDQAYPQWCDYFAVPAFRDQPWHVNGCLIGDKERFRAAGLLPDGLPPFLHGFAIGDWLWLYEQGSDYYRRHLLLHEGTHAFMNAALGSCGPPWYMEGMAELLATHQVADGRVALGYLPVDRDEVPGWGRVRMVRDAVADHRLLTIDDVLRYGARAHVQNEPYGWCWAAAAFLGGHPRYRERFRRLPEIVRSPDFNRLVTERYADDWPRLAEEWEVFAANLEYGYDLARMAIDFRPGRPLPASGATVTIAADRGWQSAGVQLEAGKTYRLHAEGRYQVANDPKPWISEPGGVTIRYVNGRPLGTLLAAVHPEPYDPLARSALVSPVAVGAEARLAPTTTGTLYLRVNDSPAELADNAGTLSVRVVEE